MRRVVCPHPAVGAAGILIGGQNTAVRTRVAQLCGRASLSSSLTQAENRAIGPCGMAVESAHAVGCSHAQVVVPIRAIHAHLHAQGAGRCGRPCARAGWQHSAGLMQCRVPAGVGTLGWLDLPTAHTCANPYSQGVKAGSLLRPAGSARGAAGATLAAQAGQCGQTWATKVNYRPCLCPPVGGMSAALCGTCQPANGCLDALESICARPRAATWGRKECCQ